MNEKNRFFLIGLITGILCVSLFLVFQNTLDRSHLVDDSSSNPEPYFVRTRDSISPYIAVHLFYDHYISYNGTVTIFVRDTNYTGNCIDGWFITSMNYQRGTPYTIFIGLLFIANDSISIYGDFGIWKGSQHPYMVGNYVEVCHLNLTQIL